MVVSLLHHFLETYGVGEDHLELHADNCSGQNKNNIMMRYLMWRVATGLHKFACICLMVAGHTKFAPDWCFGLLKRNTRRTFLLSQADIEAAGILRLAVRRHAGWPSHCALLRLGDIPPRRHGVEEAAMYFCILTT